MGRRYMIEVSIKEMLDSVEALKKIGAATLPARAAFQVARIIRDVDIELKSFQTARDKLVELYGEIGENGEIKIKKNEIETFNKEIQDLLDLKIQLNVAALPIEFFDDIELTPNDVLNLSVFIEE